MPITVDPPQYTGPGDIVRFQCNISDESQYKLEWSKIGKQPLPYGSVQNGGLLILNRVRPSDSGIYVCSAVSWSSGATVSEVEVQINIVQRRYIKGLKHLKVYNYYNKVLFNN